MVSDYEGTVHLAFIPQTHFAYFNVLARLRDRTDAQQAIEQHGCLLYTSDAADE